VARRRQGARKASSRKTITLCGRRRETHRDHRNPKNGAFKHIIKVILRMDEILDIRSIKVTKSVIPDEKS